MELVKNSPRDCYVWVQKTTMIILERLNHVLALEGHIQSTSDRAQYNDLQSLLCATLQVCNMLKFLFGTKHFEKIYTWLCFSFGICACVIKTSGV